MSLELQIIRLQEFVRLGPRGALDLKTSKAALAVLAGACLKRGIRQAILDLRALMPGPKPVFSPSDLVSLVQTFREIGFTPEHRLAVLYMVDPHQRARMFASIARLRGWSVRAFDNFEQAVCWLADGQVPQPAPQPPEKDQNRKKRVPVRKAASLQKPSSAPASFHAAIQKKPLTAPKHQSAA